MWGMVLWALLIPDNLIRSDYCDPCLSHVFQRSRDVIGLEFHTTTGVFDNVSFEAKLQGVERGEFDAIVGGEAANENLGNIALAEVVTETGRLTMTVVEKAAVAINLRGSAFGEDPIPLGAIQAGNEVRAGGVLYTMLRPQDLRQAVQIDNFADRVSKMIGRETSVIGRVPILRSHDEIEGLLELIDDRDDAVALRNGESAAGDEVVLNIDQDECFHGSGGVGAAVSPRAARINCVRSS